MNNDSDLKKNHFDPHTRFFDLAIVRYLAGTIFFFAVLAGSAIAFESKLSLNLSYEGFNNFLVVYRFPIGVMAVLIPVIAVLAANHRSAQTKEQMHLTQEQIKYTQTQIKITTENNAFSNYFKHSEEFDKYLTTRSSVEKLFSANSRHLHRSLFPDAKQGIYHVNTNTFKKIDNHIEAILQASKVFSERETMATGTKFLSNVLGSLITKYNFVHPEAYNDETYAFGSNEKNRQLTIIINDFARSIIAALEFDEKANPSDLLVALTQFNYDSIRHNPINFKDNILFFNFRDEIRQIVDRHQAQAKMAHEHGLEID
ncbi:hypothetical protein HBO34_15885 [Pseudomonas veronii]|uniref:hypothetical protein n=1 Tax=Pseudomonas veronii TaxID=76761 RepID=UPI001473FAB0|nr:hypothetical protein [Pseudomonas veronii]NMX39355.1 hypothetical protein [Pseudomonas veronii]